MNTTVNIQDIHVKENVRKHIDINSDAFNSLKESIKVKSLIQPLTVYKDKDKLYLVAGHRRLKALQLLKAKKASIYEVPAPNGDLSAYQIDENTLREGLSLFEEVSAFRQMFNESNTIQKIKDKFPHSNKYIKNRLQLSNLNEVVLKAEYFDGDRFDIEAMLAVAKSSQENQLVAIDKVRGKLSRKAYLDKYFSEWVRADQDWTRRHELTHNKPSFETMVELCGSEEKLMELQKEMGFKQKKTLRMFTELSEDYLADSDFVDYILLSEHPEIHDWIRTIPINTKLNSFDDDTASSPHIAHAMLSFINTPEYRDKVKSWKGWSDGQVVFQYKSKKKAASGNAPVERSDYYGQTKKFGKVLAPRYLSYFKDALFVSQKKGCVDKYHTGVSSDVVEKWSIKQFTELKDISVADHLDGYNLERIRLICKDSDKNVMEGIYRALLIEGINQSSISSLNKLAKSLDLLDLKGWFKQEWLKNDAEFQREVYNCFTTKNLNKISTGKKKDIVEYAVINKVKFPFISIFSSKEANWSRLMFKGNYIHKNDLYSNLGNSLYL